MQALRRLCCSSVRAPTRNNGSFVYRKFSNHHHLYAHAGRSYTTTGGQEEFKKDNSGSSNDSNGNSASIIETLKKEIAEKDRQLKELKDSYLLSLADMENLRQRTKRDIDAASHFAIQRFSKDIVSVADVLEMALGSMTTEEANEKQWNDLREGLSMTLGELDKVLKRHGVTVINPQGEKFDPNLHNALYEIPTEEVEAGMIVKVQKKGYMLHQRVIRPADVGVSRKP